MYLTMSRKERKKKKGLGGSLHHPFNKNALKTIWTVLKTGGLPSFLCFCKTHGSLMMAFSPSNSDMLN